MANHFLSASVSASDSYIEILEATDDSARVPAAMRSVIQEEVQSIEEEEES